MLITWRIAINHGFLHIFVVLAPEVGHGCRRKDRERGWIKHVIVKITQVNELASMLNDGTIGFDKSVKIIVLSVLFVPKSGLMNEEEKRREPDDSRTYQRGNRIKSGVRDKHYMKSGFGV